MLSCANALQHVGTNSRTSNKYELFEEDMKLDRFFDEAAELEEACAAYLRATNKKRCTIAEREYLNAMLNSIADADIVLDAITEAAASTDNVNLKYIAAIARERAGVRLGAGRPATPQRIGGAICVTLMC
jgi:hypothetical protein